LRSGIGPLDVRRGSRHACPRSLREIPLATRLPEGTKRNGVSPTRLGSRPSGSGGGARRRHSSFPGRSHPPSLAAGAVGTGAATTDGPSSCPTDPRPEDSLAAAIPCGPLRRRACRSRTAGYWMRPEGDGPSHRGGRAIWGADPRSGREALAAALARGRRLPRPSMGVWAQGGCASCTGGGGGGRLLQDLGAFPQVARLGRLGQTTGFPPRCSQGLAPVFGLQKRRGHEPRRDHPSAGTGRSGPQRLRFGRPGWYGEPGGACAGVLVGVGNGANAPGGHGAGACRAPCGGARDLGRASGPCYHLDGPRQQSLAVCGPRPGWLDRGGKESAGGYVCPCCPGSRRALVVGPPLVFRAGKPRRPGCPGRSCWDGQPLPGPTRLSSRKYGPARGRVECFRTDGASPACSASWPGLLAASPVGSSLLAAFWSGNSAASLRARRSTRPGRRWSSGT